jgi:sugar O-acyltransferase (sialic acid O-acetyltransferase NeuD family)
MNYLNVLGFGGYSKVVISLIKHTTSYEVKLYDDAYSNNQLTNIDLKICGPINDQISGPSIIAIGNNYVRKKVDTICISAQWIKLIHSKAFIEDDVSIGNGTVIMAGAIIQPGVKIGCHCIINTGANIDHDCVVGDFCHIGPNAALSGGVKVGEGSFIGIGSSVIPYITIGKWSTIEAGSAVNQNISDNCNVAGVPAVLNFTTKNK